MIRFASIFNIPKSMTVNGETLADINETMLEKLQETEKRGFIQIRNKKWKK